MRILVKYFFINISYNFQGMESRTVITTAFTYGLKNYESALRCTTNLIVVYPLDKDAESFPAMKNFEFLNPYDTDTMPGEHAKAQVEIRKHTASNISTILIVKKNPENMHVGLVKALSLLQEWNVSRFIILTSASSIEDITDTIRKLSIPCYIKKQENFPQSESRREGCTVMDMNQFRGEDILIEDFIKNKKKL